MAKPTPQRFQHDLKDGVIIFTFTKKSDGSTRQAKGTLDKRLMPDSLKSWRRKTQRRAPKDSIVYYDLDKGSIRSFKAYMLQKVQKHDTYAQLQANKDGQPNDNPKQPNEKS